MPTRNDNELGKLSTRLMLEYNALGPAAKAAWDARRDAWGAAEAQRSALSNQLLDIERLLRNINPLPVKHPARAQEDGLLAQAAELREQIAAIKIPRAPWQR